MSELKWQDTPPEQPGLYVWTARGRTELIRLKDIHFQEYGPWRDFPVSKWEGSWFGPAPDHESKLPAPIETIYFVEHPDGTYSEADPQPQMKRRITDIAFPEMK